MDKRMEKEQTMRNHIGKGNLEIWFYQCIKILLSLSMLYVITGCSEKFGNDRIIKVKNPLKIDRSFETVELDRESLGVDRPLEFYIIRDMDTKKIQVSQLIDEDGDGVHEKLLFQPQVKGLGVREFEIVFDPNGNENKWDLRCYSRFVPERTDDYAWENDKVAFRTFGPTAQKMVEQGISGGTLTSGIDAWLKKVDYPIIDKWYAKTVSGKGSYHKDTGEGLDNFHVGGSRGVGGIAVKEKDTYYFSKNFVSWKTLANGPIRTSFELSYNVWSAGDKIIEETKKVSLDYGSNLSKYDISIHGTDQISAGLTMHENDGEVTINDIQGYISYWQPHGESELGTAIIIPKDYFDGYEIYESTETDMNNLYGHVKVIDNHAVYYAGFGWKESGQFKSREDWENYLSLFVEKMNNPMTIELK